LSALAVLKYSFGKSSELTLLRLHDMSNLDERIFHTARARKEEIVSKGWHYKTLLPGELEYKEITEDPKPETRARIYPYIHTHS
jgi:hypothetical protein